MQLPSNSRPICPFPSRPLSGALPPLPPAPHHPRQPGPLVARSSNQHKRKETLVYLREPNILALLPKALTADIEAVFSDEAGFVGADAASVSISRVLLRGKARLGKYY